MIVFVFFSYIVLPTETCFVSKLLRRVKNITRCYVNIRKPKNDIFRFFFFFYSNHERISFSPFYNRLFFFFFLRFPRGASLKSLALEPGNTRAFRIAEHKRTLVATLLYVLHLPYTDCDLLNYIRPNDV